MAPKNGDIRSFFARPASSQLRSTATTSTTSTQQTQEPIATSSMSTVQHQAQQEAPPKSPFAELHAKILHPVDNSTTVSRVATPTSSPYTSAQSHTDILQPAELPTNSQDAAPAPSPSQVRTKTSPQPANLPPPSREATPAAPLSDDDYDFLRSSPPSDAGPRQPVPRTAVIAESDDDGAGGGFDSDDSDELPDLFGFATVPSRTVAATPPRSRGGVAKQGFLSSPLTIQSKKRKFDMAALLRIDEEDRAAKSFVDKIAEDEEERRARIAASAENHGDNDDDDDDNDDADDEGEALRKLQKTARDTVAAGAADKEDVDQAAMKMQVSRVLAQSSGGSARPGYLFFDESVSTDGRGLVVGNAFPVKKAKGPWAILADKEDRTRHFQSGLPYDIQAEFQMPDEIFLWILDEVCHETRRDLAAEYVNLLGLCGEHMHRLVTPAIMQKCFRNLGASKDVEHLTSPIRVKKDIGLPYQSRNWTCLEKFLCLLETVAGFLQLDTLVTTMQILLRLGMDRVAVENFGLAQEWRWTMDIIARSVPEHEWTNFCQQICTSVFNSTEKARLRYQAIAALGPVQKPESSSSLQYRTLDLKRRLASVFFFNQLALSDKQPEDTVTIRAVIDRLEDDPFIINSRTNYVELTGLIMMLSAALGDASRDTVATTAERSREFDAEVDELADSLMGMLSRVMPQNHGIRVECIEARTALEMVRERLLYQVRTRKKPRITGILLHEKGSEEADYLPRQQGFMKGFLKKKKVGSGDAVRPSIETEMVA